MAKEKAKRMRLPRRYLVQLLVLLMLTLKVRTAESFEVTIENNVTMKTRDGVALSADIYRPKADGKFPVLLERTPYDKHRMTYNGVAFGLQAAAQGYVYIIQDCRGRFASEGEWYPFKYESQDGYDAVEWAAGLTLYILWSPSRTLLADSCGTALTPTGLLESLRFLGISVVASPLFRPTFPAARSS
jgi:predicted acyl esterase